jgi:hypothetical protein
MTLIWDVKATEIRNLMIHMNARNMFFMKRPIRYSIRASSILT